ncbi:hypothetical protein ACWD6I_02360 [Streptomyces sp. NPDC002454]
MDPISATVLVALATGVGGEAGRQAWLGLGRLVGRRRGEPDPSAAPAGEEGTDRADGTGAPVEDGSELPGRGELVALTDAPDDERRAVELADALTARAEHDAEFRELLAQWWDEAREAAGDGGPVHNSVSGGTQHGPVVQGRDFSAITFNL